MTLHILHPLKRGAARCPRFGSCNAPICPLDPDWRRAQHLKGEAVCGLLSELVKDGGEARLRGCVPCVLVDTLTVTLPKITATWASIRKQLERASRTGSRLESSQRLKDAKKGVHTHNTTRPATVAPVRTSIPVTAPLNSGSRAIGDAHRREAAGQ
jgi:hypothetical protein